MVIPVLATQEVRVVVADQRQVELPRNHFRRQRLATTGRAAQQNLGTHRQLMSAQLICTLLLFDQPVERSFRLGGKNDVSQSPFGFRDIDQFQCGIREEIRIDQPRRLWPLSGTRPDVCIQRPLERSSQLHMPLAMLILDDFCGRGPKLFRSAIARDEALDLVCFGHGESFICDACRYHAGLSPPVSDAPRPKCRVATP